MFDSVCTYIRRIFISPSTAMQCMFHQVCHYLILLTEVDGEDLGVAHGPFDPVKGSSGGDCFLCSGVLRGQKRKGSRAENCKTSQPKHRKKWGNRWSEMDESTEVTTITQMLLSTLPVCLLRVLYKSPVNMLREHKELNMKILICWNSPWRSSETWSCRSRSRLPLCCLSCSAAPWVGPVWRVVPMGGTPTWNNQGYVAFSVRVE